ncbi:hypothetical protein [Noviherbaspirillum autotrophicum]|nr:hypothetical protein [Noviherbaspirillum autotrophicum]
MPTVTAFIDDLREAFGKEMIDGQIRRGIRGEPVFYACENGVEIGTKVNSGAAVRVTWDAVTGRAVSEEIKRESDK